MEVDEFERNKLVKEIVDKNPRIILISGSFDPTFSNDSFSYCLAQFNDELIQFSGNRLSQYNSETEVVKKSKYEWVLDTIKNIEDSHEMTLIKEKENYYIFNDYGEPMERYYYEGEFILDYGGVIELIL